MPRSDARLPVAVQLATDDAASWDLCVKRLLGPRLVGEPSERHRRQALELAAAALRFAGEAALAANLLEG